MGYKREEQIMNDFVLSWSKEECLMTGGQMAYTVPAKIRFKKKKNLSMFKMNVQPERDN